jgi:hypothetical protein
VLIVSVPIRALLTMFWLLFALGRSAATENEWVLWERPLDVQRQTHGEWRPKRVFEAERWCRGAMTVAINQALAAGGRAGRRAPAAEYQCLPSGADPRASLPGAGRQ